MVRKSQRKVLICIQGEIILKRILRAKAAMFSATCGVAKEKNGKEEKLGNCKTVFFYAVVICGVHITLIRICGSSSGPRTTT
jgi:hypothetical protein